MRKIFSFISFVLIFSSIAFGQLAQIEVQLNAVNGPNAQAMRVGLDVTATNGIDVALGEAILPPPPPAGAYDVRFDLTNYGAPYQSWKDFRPAAAYPFTGTTEHKLQWQMATGASTMVFEYVIPANATMNIKDPFGGGIFNSGVLSGTGSYNVPAPTFNQAILTMTYTGISPIVLGPVFAINPPALTFGTVNVGANAVLPVTISNPDGTADLIVSNIVSSDGQFTFAPNTFPINVAINGSTIVNVTFTPTAAGPASGNLTISHNAPGGSALLPVSGIGYIPAPVFGVTAGPLNFGTVNIGVTSAAQNLTVTNTGDADLTVTAASGNAQFAVLPATLVTIPAGGNAVFGVTFAPSASGPQTTNITFTHNAGAPVDVVVNGIGHSTAPFFTINPVSLAFGQVSVGASSTLPVTVTNTGDALLTISGIVSSSPLFTFAPNTFPIDITGGGNAVVQVTFTPVDATSLNENLTFTHNAAGSPNLLPVSGTGRTQGGSLEFVVADRTLLDGTIDDPLVDYPDAVVLRNYTGQPLKALQFDIVVGKDSSYLAYLSIEKGAAIMDTNFILTTQRYAGPTLPDGSSIDRIKVVVLGIGAAELPIGVAEQEIVKFRFDIAQINGPHATTYNALENVKGATSTPVANANLSTGPNEVIHIDNGTPWGLLGDVNLDNHVDMLDILLMIDYILGRVTFTAEQFTMGDISPWVIGAILPVPDGVIDVMDLAVLEHIVLTQTYPSGQAVYKFAGFPLNFIAVNNENEMTPGMNAKLTFFVSKAGVSIKVESVKKLKGVQIDLSEISSLIPDNTLMSSYFTTALYHQNNSSLRILAFDSQSNAMDAGEYLVASLPFTLNKPQDLQINGILVADENNKEMDKIEVEVVYEESVLPSDYMLYQNYPNPFNPSTLVRFSVPKDDFVTIKVYDMVGQEVTTLFSGMAKTGMYTMNWNGKDQNGNMVSSGSYLYRMTAGNFVQSKKMMFLK